MKESKFKKWLLPIGAVAMTTLPFVSVVSCSKSQKNPDGNSNGDQTSKPTPTKELINYSASFNYVQDSMIHDFGVNLLVNFDDWKNKILNNQVKWFNEDGSRITYEVNIHLEAGIFMGSRFADINRPQSTEKGNRNIYKIINKKPIDLKWEFYKKANNDSFGWDDFVTNVITEVPFKYDGEYGDVVVAFPIDDTIATAHASGKDINNSKILSIAYTGIRVLSRFEGEDNKKYNGTIIIESNYATVMKDEKPQNWNSIKNKFNPINSFDNNYWVKGLENSQDEGDIDFDMESDLNNIKGTISIKAKNSN